MSKSNRTTHIRAMSLIGIVITLLYGFMFAMVNNPRWVGYGVLTLVACGFMYGLYRFTYSLFEGDN